MLLIESVNIMKKKSYFIYRFFAVFLILFILGTDQHMLSPTPIVYAAQKNIKLNVRRKKMLKNETFTIKVYRTRKKHTVSFQVEDSSIISILSTQEKECTIQALSVGTTNVYVTITNTKKPEKSKVLKCKISVTPPAASIQFRISSYNMPLESYLNLYSLIALKPSYTAELPVFEVTEGDCITVSPNGFVSTLYQGSATVTASISSGKSDQITIYVE